MQMFDTLTAVLGVVVSFALVDMALVFNNTVMGFFGGVASIFTGIYFISDIYWLAMVFFGIGIYFILASVWLEWD